ncbi:AAA family ATPase [Candidatus Altiarchaeota archaeon]
MDYNRRIFEPDLEYEYHNLGNDYYKLGEFQKAIEHYNKALELRPDLLETYFNRGLAHTRLQQYDKAIEDLNKVIELNPNLAEAYYTRGLVREYKQEYDKAIADYDKALEIDPNYTKATSQKEVAESKKASIAGAGAAGAPGAPPAAGAVGVGGGGGQGGAGEGEVDINKEFDLLFPNMLFRDVAGLDKTKEKLKEAIIYPLSNPELAKRYGKTPGGGIIFYGPPGCGKTFITKAAAGEVTKSLKSMGRGDDKASFIAVKMSDIVDMYAGNTEKNTHRAFNTARNHPPALLFFDEIDGLGGKREEMGQSFEKRAINQFLTEMDGAEYDNEGVLVIGATNAPWDVDAALRRAGRFSKLVYFPEPDKKTRQGVFKLNLKNRPISKRLNLGRLARMTEGYSNADVAALCDAAASVPWKEALKTGRERPIRFSDFRKAMKEAKSSLPHWYGSVKKKLIEKTEDDDKKDQSQSLSSIIFDSGYSGDHGEQVVKHKQENKDLLSEEERQKFDDLIKDIKKMTDPTHKMIRKLKVLFAKYAM